MEKVQLLFFNWPSPIKKLIRFPDAHVTPTILEKLLVHFYPEKAQGIMQLVNYKADKIFSS